MKIVGYKHYDFKTEEGKVYSGYKIYCTCPGYGNTIGDTVESFSVSDRVCESCNFQPSVGLDIEISYRRESKSVARVFVV